MALNSPCRDLVTRWIVGPAHTPRRGPHPRGVGLPDWVLGCAHGLGASARALGAGTEVLLVEAGGRKPGRVLGVTPWGLLRTGESSFGPPVVGLQYRAGTL